MDDAAWDAVLDVDSLNVAKGRAAGAEFGLEKAAVEAREAGRKQGRALGTEFGFYKSVTKSLGQLQRDPGLRAAWLARADAAGPSSRATALRAVVSGGLDKESTIAVLATLQTLVDAFPVGAAFTEEVHAAFLKIRAKFRVLENRLGLVLDITPPLVPATHVAQSLEF